MNLLDRQPRDLEAAATQTRLVRLNNLLFTSGSFSLGFGEALLINGFRRKTEGEFEVPVRRMLKTGEGDLVQVDSERVTQADLQLVQDQLNLGNPESGLAFERSRSIRSAVEKIQKIGQAIVS